VADAAREVSASEASRDAPAGTLAGTSAEAPVGTLAGTPAIRIEHAAVAYGERRIWDGLDLTVPAGEFLAVLGPNGAGKTTLLKVVLGLERPSGGTVEVEGHAPRRGSKRIGYIPQQRAFDRDLPVRGRDLVRFGLDGHRPGVLLARRESRRRVDEVIGAVGATAFAGAPVGRLSGGEQQRLRIAQALLGDPAILLCDEPLLSLDVAHQHIITALIDQRRRQAGTTIVFVTHDINPVLPYVDRVLYLVGGRFAVGSPAEILTRERLSSLYGAEVDVVRAGGRVVVVSSDDDELSGAGDGHHPPAVCPPESWED
jgi:zinc/manganese transport system ATP-binding protein